MKSDPTKTRQAITREEGLALLKELRGKPLYSPESRHWNKQSIHLMDDLSERCLIYTLKNNESDYELEAYYYNAEDLVQNLIGIQQATNKAQHHDFHGDSDDDIEWKATEIDYIVWLRKDPNISFQEGYESKDYFGYEDSWFLEILKSYLKMKWLRHPFVDWVFLDMMITREICTYGESVKQLIPLTNKDRFGSNKHYFDNKGVLSEMTKPNWTKNFTTTIYAIIIPVISIYLLFHNGYNYYATIFSAIYGILIIVSAIYQSYWSKKPIAISLKLWESMYEVWCRLSGELVSPPRIKEAMIYSAKHGAVWDEAAYVLIDKIEQQYGLNWIVDFDE